MPEFLVDYSGYIFGISLVITLLSLAVTVIALLDYNGLSVVRWTLPILIIAGVCAAVFGITYEKESSRKEDIIDARRGCVTVPREHLDVSYQGTPYILTGYDTRIKICER